MYLSNDGACIGANGKPRKSYGDQVGTDIAAHHVFALHGKKVVSYSCGQCGAWHLAPKERYTPCRFCGQCGKEAYDTEYFAQLVRPLVGGSDGRCGILLLKSPEGLLQLINRSLLSALMASCLTGCSLNDGSRTLVLIPNPIGAVASQIEQHRIKGPNDSWTLFVDRRRERENELGFGFNRLCDELSINESQLIQISGFRILKMNSLASFPARGYPTAIDFYGSFNSSRKRAVTVVEAIETAIASEGLSAILEFQEEGVWKRSRFDPNVGRTVKSDAVDLVASHGIVFTQIPTQHEDRYSIYAVEIRIIELATGKVIARNVGLVKDIYLGAHNRFALLPDSGRCGYPVEENFVGSWLLSLIRPHPAGSTDPYDGFAKRQPVTDENRHWSSRSRRP